MSPRDDLKLDFLHSHDIKNYQLIPLQADASFRTYDRILTAKGARLILMNCPPEHYSVEPFVRIATLLLENNIKAPRIFNTDAVNGFVLLEDFGDIRIKDILTNNFDKNYNIYCNVIDLLRQVQCIDTKMLGYHDNNALLDGISLYYDWYIPMATYKHDGIPDNDQLEKIREQHKHFKAECLEQWSAILQRIDQTQSVVALRDFHVENLMHIDQNTIGVLDFQDALISHPAYDLVSLLEDARYNVPQQLADELILYYLANQSIDRESFIQSYHILGAQRNTRILGVFARKAIRDGQIKYLDFIPRVLEYLQRDLMHPVFPKYFVDKMIPKPSFCR